MIEQELFNHLVVNVPSVSGMVFANILHHDTEKPALVYNVMQETSVKSFSCGYDDVDTEWVIHLYHTEYLKNKEIKNEVKDAIASFPNTVGDITVEDGFDEESELFVQIIQFSTKE